MDHCGLGGAAPSHQLLAAWFGSSWQGNPSVLEASRKVLKVFLSLRVICHLSSLPPATLENSEPETHGTFTTNTIKLPLKLQDCLLVAFLRPSAFCPRPLPSGDTLFILQRLFLHHQITKYMREDLKFDLLTGWLLIFGFFKHNKWRKQRWNNPWCSDHVTYCSLWRRFPPGLDVRKLPHVPVSHVGRSSSLVLFLILPVLLCPGL